jgi:hypothetical protein
VDVTEKRGSRRFDRSIRGNSKEEEVTQSSNFYLDEQKKLPSIIKYEFSITTDLDYPRGACRCRLLL